MFLLVTLFIFSSDLYYSWSSITNLLANTLNKLLNKTHFFLYHTLFLIGQSWFCHDLYICIQVFQVLSHNCISYFSVCLNFISYLYIWLFTSPHPLFFPPGNGDILSFEDANQHFKYSGSAGLMIARGALIKPWIFTEIKEQRWGGK